MSGRHVSDVPVRHRAFWPDFEDAQLRREAKNDGTSIEHIAETHGRSIFAIVRRMEHLDLPFHNHPLVTPRREAS